MNKIALISASVTVGAITLGVVAVTQLAMTSSARDLGLSQAGLPTSAVSQVKIIERVKNMTAITKRIDRIEAKATTWGAYLQSHDLGGTLLIDPTALTTPVWVVAVGGDFVPAHSRGAKYTWGVMVFDATTGQWLRTDAGPTGSWPSFFDQMP